MGIQLRMESWLKPTTCLGTKLSDMSDQVVVPRCQVGLDLGLVFQAVIVN